MISLHGNGLFHFAQGVPPAGAEADPVAERGACQPRLAVPHDLVSRLGIVFPVAVSAEVRDQAHRRAFQQDTVNSVFPAVYPRPHEDRSATLRRRDG